MSEAAKLAVATHYEDAVAYYAQVDVPEDLDAARLAEAVARVASHYKPGRATSQSYDVCLLKPADISPASRLWRRIRQDAALCQREDKWIVSLAPLGPRRHRLVLIVPGACTHHTTVGLLVRQIEDCYAHPDCEVSAIDSAQATVVEEAPRTDSELPANVAGRRYWQDGRWVQLVSAKIPIERRVPEATTFSPGQYSFRLDANLSAEIRDQSARAAISPSAWLLALWQVLLWQLLGRSPFATGVMFDGRHRAELKDALGLRERPLPVICEPDGNLRFHEFAKQLQQCLNEHRAWQEYFTWPAEGHRPFSVLFETRPPSAAIRAGGRQWKIIEVTDCRDDYCLRCCCELGRGRIRITLYHNATRIHKTEVRALGRQFADLARVALDGPERSLKDVVVPGHLFRPAKSADGVRQFKSVAELFVEQAEKTPDRMAVVAPDGTRSYAELLIEASRIAEYLRRMDVGPDAVVAVTAEPSVRTLSALWGVMLAGGAYAPLDIETPAAYREKQLAASRIRLVLAGNAKESPIGNYAGRIVAVSDVERARSARTPVGMPKVQPAHLAYVIHTSGSSGMPKAVGVTQAALANYTQAICEELRLLKERRQVVFALAYSLAADLGNTCLFPALTCGGCLHVLPKATVLDGSAFAQYMATHGIDVLKAVPSHLRALLNHDPRVLPRKWLICGGEPFHADLYDRIRAAGAPCSVINHYGPTEATVGCLMQRLNPEDDVLLPAILPVGRPLANTESFVLDKAMRPVGLNMPGELFVGGAGLGRGYLHQPDQTAERFVPHPFSETPGQRLYRTGDVARWRRDGRVQILGRTDDQVKVRGHRIELSELEAILVRHPAVSAGALVVVPDHAGAARLTAYIVRDRGVAATDQELREFLALQLPPAMIPSEFIYLESLPLRSNGKVDKTQLAALTTRHKDQSTPTVSHRSNLEEIIADIWKQVLGRDSIGTADNFFDLGGDSIAAIQIAAGCRTVGLNITPMQLFEHPTIGQLAASLARTGGVPRSVSDSKEGATPTAVQPAAGVEQYPLTPLQQGLLFHCLSSRGERLYTSELVLTLASDFDPDAFARAWQRVVDRHSIFRTAFRWDHDGEPVQVVLPHVAVHIHREDWSNLTAADQMERLERYSAAVQRAGIDLTQAPLMRIALMTLPGGRYQYIWIYHHLVMDGWSEAILADELTAYYEAFRQGRECTRPVPAPYREYVEWLRRKDSSDGETFWLKYLRGFRKPTALPGQVAEAVDVDSPPAWDAVQVAISTAESEALQALSRRERLTLNTIVQGAWALVLGEYGGDTDVVFGATVVVRPPELPRLNSTIGLFLNTLPVRVRLSSNATALAWLWELQRDQFEMREHSHIPLVRVQSWSEVPKGTALFETFIGFQNPALTHAGRSTGPTVSPFVVESGSFRGGWTNYALSVDVELHEEILLTISFDKRRLTAGLARQVLACLQAALSTIATRPTATVGSLRRALADTRRQSLIQQQHQRFLRTQREQLTGPLR